MKTSSLLILFSFLLIGCESRIDSLKLNPDTPLKSATAPASQATQPGGVIDASGGDLIRASKEEVEAAVTQLPLRLSLVLNRMKMMIVEKKYPRIVPSFVQMKGKAHNQKDEPWRDHMSRGTVQRQKHPSMSNMSEDLIQSFFYAKNKFDMTADKIILSDQIKIQLIDGDCHCQLDGAKDASATSDGEVCFSLKRLLNYSAYSLPVAVTSLGAHELAHVLNFNEEDARSIQRVIEWDQESLFLESELKEKSLYAILSMTWNMNWLFDRLEELPSKENAETVSAKKLERIHLKIQERMDAVDRVLGDLESMGERATPRFPNFIFDTMDTFKKLKEKMDAAAEQDQKMIEEGLDPTEEQKEVDIISITRWDGKVVGIETKKEKLYPLSRMDRREDFASIDEIYERFNTIASNSIEWLYGTNITEREWEVLSNLDAYSVGTDPEFIQFIDKLNETKVIPKFVSVFSEDDEDEPREP